MLEDLDKHPNSTTVILKFGPIITDFSVYTAEQATALLYKVTSLNTMKLSTPKLAFTLRPQVQSWLLNTQADVFPIIQW